MGLSSCLILLGSGLIYSYSGLTNLELIFTLTSIYQNSIELSIFNNLLNSNGYAIPLFEVLNSISSIFHNITENIVYDTYALNNEKIRGIIIGFLLIFSGFLFKIAASPFHNWAPDVYDDSPTLVTAWLTIMPKISILIFLLQIIIGIDGSLSSIFLGLGYDVSSITSWPTHADTAKIIINLICLIENSKSSINVLTNLLLLSSLLSLIIGAIVGLSQIRLKRLLA